MTPRITSRQINQAIMRYAARHKLSTTIVRNHSRYRAKAIEEYMEMLTDKPKQPSRSNWK